MTVVDLIFALAFVAGLSLLVFRDLLGADVSLFMTDNNIGFSAMTGDGKPASFVSGFWMGGPLLGSCLLFMFSLRTFLEWIFPLIIYVNWFHAAAFSLSSIFLFMFCLKRGCDRVAILPAIMVAFWLGSDLTLTYSGHDGKYGVLVCAAMGLWLIEMAACKKSFAYTMLAGGAVGMMFVEQQDVALFIGLFLGAYAVYAILREQSGKWRALVLPLIIMGTMALLVGGPNVLSGYLTQVKGVVAMSDENPQQKWDYCTQWSLPPEDMLEFIAPGFRGLRSGEPEGPYWGRQGRSAGWEETHQGFQNFKLEGLYVGMIPIALALFSLMLVLKGRGIQNSEFRVQNGKKPSADEDAPVLSQRRGDVIFWSVVTIVALLLALGKFFPLYWLFYQIPGMSSIRNPNKFLHVFQIGLGVLTAFGADALLRGIPEQVAAWSKRYAIAIIGLAALMFVWVGYLASSRDALVNEFTSSGWSRYAPVMVDRMVGGALHAALITSAIGLGLLALVAWRKRHVIWRSSVMVVLVLVLVADVLSLAKDYIKVVKLNDLVGENAVTSFLKQNLNQQRLYLLSQEGFYNNWLTVLFPYHGIETFNVSQMPRMPEDYDRWLKSVGKDPLRLWQLSAIGYVLAPDQAWQQIRKEPRFARHFEEAKGFNLYASGNGVGVTEVAAGGTAQHHILRFKDGLPRFKLFHDWAVVPDEAVGSELIERIFDPHGKVLVAPDCVAALPKPLTASNSDPETVSSQLSATDARVTAVAASPSVLMFVNKHSSDWRVTVDGKSAPLLRCNSLCLGVYLEPGKHDVRFYLRNQWGLFGTQMAGLLVCLIAMVSLWIPRKTG